MIRLSMTHRGSFSWKKILVSDLGMLVKGMHPTNCPEQPLYCPHQILSCLLSQATFETYQVGKSDF